MPLAQARRSRRFASRLRRDSTWIIARAGESSQASFAALVLATPAAETGGLLRGIGPSGPRFGELLGKIEYAGVAQVSAGYRLDQIEQREAKNGLNGFGFLVPRSEWLHLLGTVWSSSLFPDRAPEGMASFTSFLGGMTDAEIVSRDPDEIAAVAHSELSSVLGISGTPVAQRVSRWQRALPQYNVGHRERHRRTAKALRRHARPLPGRKLFRRPRHRRLRRVRE